MSGKDGSDIHVRQHGGAGEAREGELPDSAEKKANAIRSEIEQTRASMSGTLNQIEERLSPAHLKEQVLEQFHDAKEKVKIEVKDEISSAKELVRHEIQEAKHAMREATIGRVEHMVHNAGETIQGTSNTLVSTIRANPIPAILAGIGLTWLFMSARNQRTIETRNYGPSRDFRGYGARPRGYGFDEGGRYPAYGAVGSQYGQYGEHDHEGTLEHGQRAVKQAVRRAGETAGHLADQVRDAAGNAVHGVRDAAGNLVDQAGNILQRAEDRVGHLAHDASDRVGSLVHRAEDAASHFAHDASERAAYVAQQARREAIRLENSVERTMRENPLAVGAAALALGTVVGLSLPTTRREDELLGGVRDQLFEKATHLAEDAVGTVREKVEGVVDQIGASDAQQGSQGRSQNQGQTQGQSRGETQSSRA
jgi:hypothetical protein